jgi:hypothetical protein
LWAPKGQPFITPSFLHNFVTVTLLKSLTFLLGAIVESENAFVCDVWNGGAAYRGKLDAGWGRGCGWKAKRCTARSIQDMQFLVLVSQLNIVCFPGVTTHCVCIFTAQ